jgi:hypothetical protein
LILSSIHGSSQRLSFKQACITPCRILPHIIAGESPDEDWRMRDDNRAFRRHGTAFNSPVAVNRISGCKMTTFEVTEIVETTWVDEEKAWFAEILGP